MIAFKRISTKSTVPPALCWILLIVVANAPSQAQNSGRHASALPQISIEQIASEPDLGPQTGLGAAHQAPLLHWSPDGARVAWLQLAAPQPNPRIKPQQEIWSLSPASPSAKAAILVTAPKVTAALRGTEVPRPLSIDENDESNPDLLHDFAWAPDHASLLLAGAQTLAWLDLATGKSRVLVSGEEQLADPAVSPDGKTVSFLQNHTLWTIPVAGGHAHRLLPRPVATGILEGQADWPYANELHLAHAYAWSPDSTQIAWLQIDDRDVDKYTLTASDGSTRTIAYPKPGGKLPVVLIFLKRLSGGLPVEIKLDAKDSYLPRLTWLPDSRHLAIQRLSRRQQTLDLLLADTATGASHVILTETDKYWINLSNDLTFFSDGKRFLWSSERTGYRHLYLYDTQGRELAQLTNGDWEVTELNGLDQSRRVAYFTATEKSPLERHLYSVSLDGGPPTRITQPAGTHEVYLSPNSRSFLDSFSSQATPPYLQLGSLDAQSPASVPPNNAAPLPLEFLNVQLHMGSEVHAFLIKPPDFDPAKKYPVIVYMAGGPGEQLVRDAWPGAAGLWMRFMAQQGYLIFAVDNHGTAGRGHYFEEPLHFRLSAQELIDQRDGLAWLYSQPYVDPARLGVCGWGYGGFLAVHAMLDRPVPFKAGFAGAPIVDWHFYDAVFAERYLDDPTVHLDGWLASVAVDNAKYFKGSLLLAQGTADEFVHIENILALQDELLDSGKSADLLLLPDRGHSIEDRPARLVLFRRMTDFFLHNLSPNSTKSTPE